MITRKSPSPETERTEQQPLRTDNDASRRPGAVTTRRQLSPTARRSIIVAAIIVGMVAIWIVFRSINSGAGTPRYLTKPVAYANISSTVEETGTVNPVNEVQVGTQVSGTINSLEVDFNSVVHKGQVLATLDPTSLQATALQVHGALAAAQSNASAASSTASQSAAAIAAAVANADVSSANARTATANVSKAQAALALSNTTLRRDSSLLAQGYIAQSQMDTDRATNNANAADVRAAQAALAAARAQGAAAAVQVGAASDQHSASVFQAQAAAAQAQAAQGQAQQAEYNLQRAVITSPIDGIVVSRAVSVGQTVAASLQTPTLFVIASSLRDMQVDVSVSEADVGQLKSGASARITVPAYPNVSFDGTVQQVRINPTTVSNVVTYDAIVTVHDGTSRLKPGMTADVTIALTTHSHALAIPAAALLFKPAGAGAGTRGAGSGPAGAASASGSSANAQPNSSTVAGARGSSASVWVLRSGKPEMVRIVLGISDERNYEVLGGQLRPGDQLIVGQLLTQQYSGSNPMAGSPGLGR